MKYPQWCTALPGAFTLHLSQITKGVVAHRDRHVDTPAGFSCPSRAARQGHPISASPRRGFHPGRGTDAMSLFV